MLRNIDYFSEASDQLLEEMTYMLELVNINQGTYVFRRGTQWTDIHLIWNGEIDIYIGNNKRESVLDTLYTGCTIGSYYSLTSDDYSISAKAKTDCTLLKLTATQILELRAENEKLDDSMIECENYIIENGLPYCDYKMYRTKLYKSSPHSKFKSGIRRIISIVRTFKSSALQDLLERVRNFIDEK